MRIFLANNKEIHPGWKIVRAIFFWILLSVLFAFLASVIRLQILSEYAVHLGMVLAVWLCLWLDKQPLGYIGLFPHQNWIRNLLIGMGWGSVSVIVVALGMMWITQDLSLAAFQGESWFALVGSLLFYLLVALGEETLFRGYIITVLRSRLSASFSLVIAAAIFTLIHFINPEYYWFAFIYAFLIGILLGGMFLRSGSLWYAVGFHFVWNFLQSEVVFNFPSRGGEVIFTLVIIANFILVRYFSKKGDL